MWFNHIIKVKTKEMLSVDHLWKFVTRGAMILCETDQEGIDIVLPVCYTTQNLSPDSVTAIIIHVTNAEESDTELNESSYDAMDPAVASAIFFTLPGSESVTATETLGSLRKRKGRRLGLGRR